MVDDVEAVPQFAFLVVRLSAKCRPVAQWFAKQAQVCGVVREIRQANWLPISVIRPDCVTRMRRMPISNVVTGLHGVQQITCEPPTAREVRGNQKNISRIGEEAHAN